MQTLFHMCCRRLANINNRMGVMCYSQCKALTTYVVIMRRRTHLMTGLAQRCDAVSALLFWMSALAVWWGQQTEGCVYVWQQIGAWVEGREEINEGAQGTKHPIRCDRKPAQTTGVLVEELRVWREKEWKGQSWSHWDKWGFDVCVSQNQSVIPETEKKKILLFWGFWRATKVFWGAVWNNKYCWHMKVVPPHLTVENKKL